MVHVPYKSTPEALQAVIAGEVDMAALTVNLTEQAILTDQVTGIAITSARRWPKLPNALRNSLRETAGAAYEQLWAEALGLLAAENPTMQHGGLSSGSEIHQGS